MFLNLVLIFIGIFQHGASVIYQLNDTEYVRMPLLYDLDKYESCLQHSNGIYCLAQITLFSNTHNDLMQLIEEYSQHTAKHYNHSNIERGICVTKTCKKYIESKDIIGAKVDLDQVLAQCVNDSFWREYKLQANVTNYFCDRHNETVDKDIFDWLVLVLILSLLALNIAGTICEVIVQRQRHEKNNNQGIKYYLLCFSIVQNWKWLVSSEPSDQRLRELKGLHCVKTLIMYLFIIGHAFYMFHGFTENPHQFEKFYDHSFYKMLFGGLVSVQMLFVISGFLLFYHLLLESEKRPITWKVIPNAVLLRLCRLTPANVVYVLFSATWLRHWSSGPIWKMLVTDKMSGDCRRYWWSHLLFINNYLPDDSYCVVQNWQLAADFQLFILGLCVFVATKHRSRKLVLNALLVLGMISMGLHIWWHDLDALLMTTPEAYRSFDNINYVVHKFSYVNLPGFVIGMLTAQILYEWQKQQVDISKYKMTLSKICHCVIPAIMVVFYSGSILHGDAERASLALRISYGVVYRPVMAIITAFIIVGMILKFDDFWVRFLEWDGWVVPSRLSYSVSLIHTFFIIVLFGSRTQLIQVSMLNHTVAYIGVAVLSFLAAIPYCLLVEAPMNKLIKVVLSKHIEQRRKLE